MDFISIQNKVMNKKEINSGNVTKNIIQGFVSYGILSIFAILLVISIITYNLNSFLTSTIRGLYITLPLMAVIIIDCIIHLICRISTYDVFKKCKTNPENYKRISKYLNIFYVICIILSIILFLSLLYLNLEYQVKSIELAELQYKEVFSEEHITLLKNEMTNTYNESKTNLTISTVILEIGVSLSFLSLIPYQKKMLTRYNEV